MVERKWEKITQWSLFLWWWQQQQRQQQQRTQNKSDSFSHLKIWFFVARARTYVSFITATTGVVRMTNRQLPLWGGALMRTKYDWWWQIVVHHPTATATPPVAVLHHTVWWIDWSFCPSTFSLLHSISTIYGRELERRLKNFYSTAITPPQAHSHNISHRHLF